MNFPAFTSIAGLLCYGWLMAIVLRRGFRETGAVHRLFLVYLGFMTLWQGSALVVSFARDERMALRWYVIMTAVVLGQFVCYAVFVRAFFAVKGHRGVPWAGFLLWGVSSLVVWLYRDLFIVDVQWSELTHFYLPVFGPSAPIVAIPNYAFLVYASVLLIRGYRRAGSAVERVRTSYLAVGLAVVVLGSLANFVPLLKPYPVDLLANIANALLIAYAIFRYQLLDISVVIRKGLLYSIPTVFIGTLYFLALSLAINLLHVTLGYQIFFLSLLLAVIAALVVQPIRDKLQAGLDKVFFREKYNSGLMLQRLSRTAATVLDLDRLTGMILDDVTKTMHIAAGVFYSKQGETGQYVLRAQTGLGVIPQVQSSLRDDHPVAAWLLKHQTALTRQQIDTNPFFIGLWTQEREALRAFQAELCVPLLVRDDLIGILILGPKLSELPYAPDDKLTLTTLANQTAVAVENARLFSLEQVKVKETSALLDVARAVSSTLDLNPLLQLIAQRAADVCRFDRCSILLVDGDGDALRLLASQFAAKGDATTRDQLQKEAQLFATVESKALLKRALQERRPITVGQESLSNLSMGRSGLLDTKDVLIVPLLSQDQAIGLMTFEHFAAERRISEDQIDLAATIASQASVAIDNARLYQVTVAEKERTATIVEQAFAGIVLLDCELRVVSLNPAAEAIIGEGAVQVIGKHCSEVFDPGLAGEGSLLRKAMMTGERVPPTEQTLFRGERRRDVLLGVAPLPDGYLLSLADITQLKELDRLKSDIIANVSHEFRTPLAIIKAYAELLMDTEQDQAVETQREFLTIIDAETDRLAGMVSDLLDIARLEAGRGNMPRALVQIDDVITEVLSLLQFQAHGRDITVQVDVPPALPALLGNKDVLMTLVRNLLGNAIKFSRPGGTVDVIARQDDGALVLQVIDRGIGIAAEDLPHLFEKFYRAKAAQDAGIRGTGLGLVLVKQAVEAHGGTIAVESQRGEGTRFIVTLPVSADGEDASPLAHVD